MVSDSKEMASIDQDGHRLHGLFRLDRVRKEQSDGIARVSSAEYYDPRSTEACDWLTESRGIEAIQQQRRVRG